MSLLNTSATLRVFVISACFCMPAFAELYAIPEPPVILYGEVTDASAGEPVPVSSISVQVTDGTTNRTLNASSLPATRIVSSDGRSYYMLEIPFETRTVQTQGGPESLAPGDNGFELKGTPTNLSVTFIVNGQTATVHQVEGIPQPANTPAFILPDYSRTNQGRMIWVDLQIGSSALDTDGDGIPDWWEMQYFGGPTNANASALAANQVNTLLEAYIAGLDPLDSASMFRFQSATAPQSGFLLRWPSVSGRVYRLERSSSPQVPGGGFQLVQEALLATPPENVYLDQTRGDGPVYFYRVWTTLQP